jgi:predicted amidohydrolase YtcJ
LALKQAGIADTVPDPLGGRYSRDAAGRITGLLEEYAGWNQWEALSPNTDSAYRAAWRLRTDSAVVMGITTIQNMSTGVDPAMLRRILPTLDLPIRVRFIRFPLTTPTGLVDSLPPRVTVSGTKYIVDGTPVERLAVFRRPYADRPGWYGRLDLPPDTLTAIVAEAIQANDQPIFHAVGDSAVGLVLQALAEGAPDSVWHRLRPRIEHGDGLSPDQFALAKRLGVVMVQNPTHFALPMAPARYGAARMAVLQPAKSLLAASIPLAIGSDGPQNPFLNIMLAVSHPDRPGEALTVEQAVTAYTAGSALAQGLADRLGTLKPGMVADLAVLSQDIFSIAAPRLLAVTSVLTIVGGRSVYDPNGWLNALPPR